MKDDGVHENFFTVPELPHKKKEREALNLFSHLLNARNNYDYDTFLDIMEEILGKNVDLVDWVMKYKGE